MTAARGRSRRKPALVIASIVVLLLVGLEASRLVQLVSALEEARSSLLAAETTGEAAGLSASHDDITSIGTDLAGADAGLRSAQDLLDGDPVITVLRLIPAIGTQLDAARTMTSAVRGLTSEHATVVRLMDRYVEVRDRPAAAGRMSQLATFVAEERDSIDRIVAALVDADAEISALADRDLVSPLAAVRTQALDSLDRIAPNAARIRPVLRAMSSLLGVGTDRRYLVLALDSAELRPVGGLIGAYATPTVRDGDLTGITFHDVADADHPDQQTYVEPPQALRDHLLGDFTWQMADAGWWPDFAQNAAEARRLFALETGDARFDGVIAFTPAFVDELIGVIGPVVVPGSGVTVAPGQTYVRSLEQVEIRNTGSTRKQFLAALASEVLRRLDQLPVDRYPGLLAALGRSVASRQVQVLPDDPVARSAMVALGAYAPFTFDQGVDRLSIMGANVAPISKLDALLDMQHELDVVLEPDGSADESLTTTYTNRYSGDLPPELEGVRPAFFFGNLGTFDRRYLAPQAEVRSVRSTGLDPAITDPESLGPESGCLTVGNYLFIRPGTVRLDTTYRTPGVVQDVDGDVAERMYRLAFRKQPGRDEDRLTVRITLPEGARLTWWSEGGLVSDRTVTFSVDTRTDHTFEVQFAPRN